MSISVDEAHDFIMVIDQWCEPLHDGLILIIDAVENMLKLLDKSGVDGIEGADLDGIRNVLVSVLDYIHDGRVPRSLQQLSYGVVAATMYASKPDGWVDEEEGDQFEYFDNMLNTLIDNREFFDGAQKRLSAVYPPFCEHDGAHAWRVLTAESNVTKQLCGTVFVYDGLIKELRKMRRELSSEMGE